MNSSLFIKKKKYSKLDKKFINYFVSSYKLKIISQKSGNYPGIFFF